MLEQSGKVPVRERERKKEREREREKFEIKICENSQKAMKLGEILVYFSEIDQMGAFSAKLKLQSFQNLLDVLRPVWSIGIECSYTGFSPRFLVGNPEM